LVLAPKMPCTGLPPRLAGRHAMVASEVAVGKQSPARPRRIHFLSPGQLDHTSTPRHANEIS
jgi:hypothetical protein